MIIIIIILIVLFILICFFVIKIQNERALEKLLEEICLPDRVIQQPDGAIYCPLLEE